MKFLRKLASVSVDSSSTISHHCYPNLPYVEAFLSYCLSCLNRLPCQLRIVRIFSIRIHLIRSRFNQLRQRMAPPHSAPFINSRVIDWAPLIKATPSLNKYNVSNQKSCDLNHNRLTGKTVLCVGGRMKLYPEYNRMINNAGGSLMTFHGNHDDHLENLSQLLQETNLIICPIDCVNHEAFLMVKHYCENSGKPCILIDRSEVSTFQSGIMTLSLMIN